MKGVEKKWQHLESSKLDIKSKRMTTFSYKGHQFIHSAIQSTRKGKCFLDTSLLWLIWHSMEKLSYSPSWGPSPPQASTTSLPTILPRHTGSFQFFNTPATLPLQDSFIKDGVGVHTCILPRAEGGAEKRQSDESAERQIALSHEREARDSKSSQQFRNIKSSRR